MVTAPDMNKNSTQSITQVTYLRKVLRFILIASCMEENPNRTTKWMCYFFMVLILGYNILGSVITLINISYSLYKIETGLRVIWCLGQVSLILYYHFYKREIVGMASMFFEDSANFIGDTELTIVGQRFRKIAKEMLLLYGLTSSPYTLLTFLDVVQSKGDKYEFLNLYSCGFKNHEPAMPFCIETDSLIYKMNKFVEPITTNILGIFFNLGGWFLFIIMTESIAVRLEMYENELLSFIEQLKSADKSCTRDYKALSAIIKLQQHIYANGQEIIALMNPPMTIHIAIVYAFGVLVILIPAKEHFSSMNLNIRLGVLFIFALRLHYSFCKNSMILSYMHDTITNILLDFPWYERNLKFQKCYLALLMICQKDNPLYVYGLYEVNLRFFAANCNRLYTLVNILSLKYK